VKGFPVVFLTIMSEQLCPVATQWLDADLNL